MSWPMKQQISLQLRKVTLFLIAFERLVLVENHSCSSIMQYYLFFCIYTTGTGPVKIALFSLHIQFHQNNKHN